MNFQPQLMQIMAQAQAMIERVTEMGQRNREGTEVVSSDSAECAILEDSLRWGHALFDLFLSTSGTGDVGETTYSKGVRHVRNKQISNKTYQSVFGMHKYSHWKYYPEMDDQKRYFSPYESRLEIQERRASYLVQDMLSSLGTNMPMGESAGVFQDFFNQSISKRTVDDIMVEQSMHLECYESERPSVVGNDGEGEILVASFDAKGVPMLKGSRLADCEGVKRMAMIGVDYTVDRQVRNAAEVAVNLVGSQFPDLCLLEKKEEAEAKVVPHAVNKHYQVSIENKSSVFEKIRLAVDHRRHHQQDLVVLVDGAPELRNQVAAHFPDATAVILDIVHVMGYLGSAVKILSKEKGNKPELLAYTEILLEHGEIAAQVIASDLESRLNAARKLTDKDEETVTAAIRYIRNNLDRMRYDQYLAAGYPIATGVIESACGMLVCDRMEFAGARWHLTGAEAVLKMRAVKKSGEWKQYQKFRKEREYRRLYAQTG